MPEFVLMPGDKLTVEGAYQAVPWWRRLFAWWRPPPSVPLVFVVSETASYAPDGTWTSLAKPVARD